MKPEPSTIRMSAPPQLKRESVMALQKSLLALGVLVELNPGCNKSDGSPCIDETRQRDFTAFLKDLCNFPDVHRVKQFNGCFLCNYYRWFVPNYNPPSKGPSSNFSTLAKHLKNCHDPTRAQDKSLVLASFHQLDFNPILDVLINYFKSMGRISRTKSVFDEGKLRAALSPCVPPGATVSVSPDADPAPRGADIAGAGGTGLSFTADDVKMAKKDTLMNYCVNAKLEPKKITGVTPGKDPTVAQLRNALLDRLDRLPPPTNTPPPQPAVKKVSLLDTIVQKIVSAARHIDMILDLTSHLEDFVTARPTDRKKKKVDGKVDGDDDNDDDGDV